MIKYFVKYLIAAFIIAVLAGLMMYALFLLDFQLSSCVLFGVVTVFILAELIIETDILKYK